MNRAIATIRENDRADGEEITISITGEAGNYAVTLSNGDAAPFGTEAKVWDAIKDVRDAWGGWTTFAFVPGVWDE